MGVSARHTRRILAAYRKEGAAALAQGNRGLRSTNATPEPLRFEVLRLAQTRRELPNPFSLTLPTSTSSGVTFPFGSLRDCGAFLRALMERFGVESRGHLIALLGMPHHTSAYDHVRHWTHGQWAIGPQYLVRILVLVLWAVKPWKFASLSDLRAVDWPGRSVKWTKRRQHEWESDGNYATPPSPFHPLLAFAQRSNGRGGPRRARAKSFEAPVAPVRAYELAQGASQV